ncbi:MAG: XRE family transcriptional regulator [Gallionella sp.]|nr:MAG: XRE family transcriptional regulator [Gallionella sp.]
MSTRLNSKKIMPDNPKQTHTKSQPQDDGAPNIYALSSAAAPEESFPKMLATLREGKGLKHDSLSELTKHVDPQKRGIARTTLRGYELGVTKPGIRELRILSQALGVTANKLIFGADTPDSALIQGGSTPEQKKFLGRERDDFIEIACFLVSMYRLSERERDTVYNVTSSLVAAKLGEVEYRKLMDATREVVETFVDAHTDMQGEAKETSQEQMIKTVMPLFKATLAKFGFPPMMPTPEE